MAAAKLHLISAGSFFSAPLGDKPPSLPPGKTARPRALDQAPSRHVLQMGGEGGDGQQVLAASGLRTSHLREVWMSHIGSVQCQLAVANTASGKPRGESSVQDHFTFAAASQRRGRKTAGTNCAWPSILST